MALSSKLRRDVSGVEGRLIIEFENGSRELVPGQLLTVPSGVGHRTRPVGGRSVNLTFELAQAETIVDLMDPR
jgi:mannose-6-phosphate isomerase-like protein (cupin superfamily)